MDGASPAAQPFVNQRLADLLQQAGWSPETLARRVNFTLRQEGSRRQINEKTPYKWRRGEIPRDGICEIVTQLLSDALGRDFSPDAVWPHGYRRAARSSVRLRADHGLDGVWDVGVFTELVESATIPSGRPISPLTGPGWTELAWRAIDGFGQQLSGRSGTNGRVDVLQIRVVEAIVAGAQQLDNDEGGMALAFVRYQIEAVIRLLSKSSYDATIGRSLASALAQLSQTAGFMSFDALNDGAAQRHFLVALRAAHAAGDRALLAGILALMSTQQADLGHVAEARQLAGAAEKASQGAAPAVRCLIAARAGLAHAGAGDLQAFERSRESALNHLELATAAEAPSWAGYADSTEVDAIAGRSLVVLAEQVAPRRQVLLARAKNLLRARAETPQDEGGQRSALRHGAWMSLACARSGDMHTAIASADRALSRAPHVSSLRSIQLLGHLADHLAGERQGEEVLRGIRHALVLNRLERP